MKVLIQASTIDKHSPLPTTFSVNCPVWPSASRAHHIFHNSSSHFKLFYSESHRRVLTIYFYSYSKSHLPSHNLPLFNTVEAQRKPPQSQQQPYTTPQPKTTSRRSQPSPSSLPSKYKGLKDTISTNSERAQSQLEHLRKEAERHVGEAKENKDKELQQAHKSLRTMSSTEAESRQFDRDVSEATMRAKITSLEKQVSSLETENEALRSERDNSVAHGVRLQAELEGLKLQLTAAESTTEGLQKALKEAHSKIGTLEASERKLQTKVTQLEGQSGADKEHIDALTKSLEEWKQSSEAYKQKAEEYKNAYDELVGQDQEYLKDVAEA